MTVSELIDQLSDFLKKNGDLEVFCCMDTDPLDLSWQADQVDKEKFIDTKGYKQVCVIR